MAQADSNLHTRRGFSKWLAGSSVAAAVPMPALAAQAEQQVSQELLSSAAELKRVYELDSDAFDKLYRAKIVLKAWRDANPQPAFADAKYRKKTKSILSALHADIEAHRQREFDEMKIVARAQAARNDAQKAWFGGALAFANVESQSMRDVLFKAEMASEYDTDICTIAGTVSYDLLRLHKIT